MMVQTLTANSPWLKRFNAYLKERFPLINGMLFFIFYLTAYTYTSFLSNPAAPVLFSGKAVLAFLAVYSFFFRLRVFDEHKDYEKDCLNHPQRVLQSGYITLPQLRSIAIAGTFLEAVVSLLFSWQVFFAWLIALIYSLLMAKEFFVGKWLEQRLFLYAFSHMLIMPLLVIWVGTIAIPKETLPASVILLGFLSFFSGLAFEVSRKIKAPNDEVPTIQTYSQLWGTKKSAWIALGCLCIATLLMSVLLYQLQASAGFYIGIYLLFFGCAWIFNRFATKPDATRAKALELASSLYMLAAYILLITATLIQTGVQWKGL